MAWSGRDDELIAGAGCRNADKNDSARNFFWIVRSIEDRGRAEARNMLRGRPELGPQLGSGLDRQLRSEEPSRGE